MRWPLLFAMTCLACRNAAPHDAEARPIFELGADHAELGYDAPFSIAVRFPATDRAPVDVRWKQIDGVPVQNMEVGEKGHRLSARTPRLSDCRQGALPWGVVPLSPRTRGAIVLEAEWQGTHDRTPQRERLVVAAAARSRGLPNVPVNHRLYLGGSGWRVKEGPPDAHAHVEERDGVATFRPDSRGIWELIDGEGRPLRIQAGRYVETPLDCGRAGCHGEITRAAQSSPMTWALSRRLHDRAQRRDAAATGPPSSDDVACAMACHATGEPGIHDGGFFDVASELGLPPSLAGVDDLSQLPRAVRRLGSVGCLACHGPSAVPEPDARWSILRSDVCAHCHDAPPRYGHVVAWQTTSMARADRDTLARSDGTCTPCHTTWGFLREIEMRSHEKGERRDELARDIADTSGDRVPPPTVGHVGIACPACHAVHDPSATETRRSLLRTPPLADMFGDLPAEARARSGVCLACHAPRNASRLPQASASPIWSGRGGLDPETGAPLAGPAPHLSIAEGCVGCHREGPDSLERGKSHGFRADRRQCTSCHTDAARAGVWEDERVRIATEARNLWSKVQMLRAVEDSPRASTDAASPPHAATRTSQRKLDDALGRAAYDVLLVLEDRGFLAHNLPYARLLIEKAKGTLERASRTTPHREERETPR